MTQALRRPELELRHRHLWYFVAVADELQPIDGTQLRPLATRR